MENFDNLVIENLEENNMIKDLMKNAIIAKLVTIALAIIAGYILIKLAGKGLEKLLTKNKDTRVTNAAKVKTVSRLLYSIIKFVVIFIVVNIILDSVGINTSSLIATAGIGGIAIAFGSQTVIKTLSWEYLS